MSKKTKIQWCDSTVNPIMGCAGCELYPTPEQLLEFIDRDLINAGHGGWKSGMASELFEAVLAQAWQELPKVDGEPISDHINEPTTTNIRHLRDRLGENVAESFGAAAGRTAIRAIERNLSCYAAQLHANRGLAIHRPLRKINHGYSPTFEQVTEFPGRLRTASCWEDMTGKHRPDKPWLNELARLIFVSDMGDAFSHRAKFEFLRSEVPAFQGSDGRRHLWLWLTKRPDIMRQFAAEIGGFPSNVCAMTTVTSTKNLKRIDALRRVDAPVRGLSLEPLWAPIAQKIDLTEIDWVIVGGESGAKKNVQPFPIEWVRELRQLCLDCGVAFFVKQLGRRPTQSGNRITLRDNHGGDWGEWPSDLRVREIPEYFRNYSDKHSQDGNRH